jgi:asparagine synthase (glutamine-hydrolysing)
MIARHESSEPDFSWMDPNSPEIPSWQSRMQCWEMSFTDARQTMTSAMEHDAALFLLGYATTQEHHSLPSQKQFAADLLRDYLEHGDLPIERLEGSFACLVFDAVRGRLLLYRNMAGLGFVYYSQRHGNLYFSSNLAKLVGLLPEKAAPNHQILPIYFLYRSVPGRQTLFADIYRLMPGEMLTFDRTGLQVTQRSTFDDFKEDRIILGDAVEQVEDTTAGLMRDIASVDPQTVNLLSGGVDSSYLQVHWNLAVQGLGRKPKSAAATVNHPATIPDRDYARSAAQLLGTNHQEYPATDPYADYLLESITMTGEPPSHVQTAYFTMMAKRMAAEGIKTGLCGECADSLFGTEWSKLLHDAKRISRVLPVPALQRLAASILKMLGSSTRWQPFELAPFIDDFSHELHPINNYAVFTHFESLKACFSESELQHAREYRRDLVNQYHVAPDNYSSVHAAALLGDTMHTASLWTTIFSNAGITLYFPFVDTRMLRLAVNLDHSWRFDPHQPKRLLKKALARYLPPEIVYRAKLTWGQPIFEWLAPNGCLRPLVDEIRTDDFVPRATLEAAKAKPNWFLFSLLCYDIWFKNFIENEKHQVIQSRQTPLTIA